MPQIMIAVLALVTMIGMSLRANRRFSGEQRLPMQWSLTGTVNWTAPRVLALSFMPALALVVLSLVTIATIVSSPRPGQEGLEIPIVSLIAISLIGVHALHHWLISKSLGAGRR